MAANSVSSFYKAIRVKCEQIWTCATCLWLLNNLSALVLKDILAHMSYNSTLWADTLTETLRPILSRFLSWIGKKVNTRNKHAIYCSLCYCDLCDAYNSKIYVLNLAFPAESVIQQHIKGLFHESFEYVWNIHSAYMHRTSTRRLLYPLWLNSLQSSYSGSPLH